MTLTRNGALTDRALETLARRAGEALGRRGWTAATAESCTGGWVAKALTDVPGSSGWFGTGFVTYSNSAKQALLAVPAPMLDEHGAVSEEVVRHMAASARRQAQADVAVAISGVAGPGGGTAAKPVGTVWFAWADPAGVEAQRRRLDGDRDAVRRQSVAVALEGLIERVEREGR
ncbi:MAG: nicotinamide-nucleotide amidohydrolase family protein [Gammaproteobacteria bacterium]|nr:nicotinamide-nucleotide amidohydrolase family protein [Gammaproteobacteria bacterium]